MKARFIVKIGLLFILLASCQTEYWTQLRKSSHDSICIVKEWSYIERSYGIVTMDDCVRLRDELNTNVGHRVYSCWAGQRLSWQNGPIVYCNHN